MKTCIDFATLSVWERNKPFQSVFYEFIRRCGREVLDLGEFEALRRWLLSSPDCFPVPITPETSHRVTRDFFKALRKEQKA